MATKGTTKKTTAVKGTKFASQLRRDNSAIRADRAERIAEAVADAQAKLIMGLKDSVRKSQNELDAMMDLSADNQTTSMNVISADFDADAFVQRINQLKTNIAVKSEELEIALETQKEWF